MTDGCQPTTREQCVGQRATLEGFVDRFKSSACITIAVMWSKASRRVAGVAKGIASGCEAVALIAGTKSQ